MVLVDTSAWFAIVVNSDRDHDAARGWFAHNHATLLTTDYIVDETLTLLARGEGTRAKELGEKLFRSAFARLYFLTHQDIIESWETFQKFFDKQWSFTDCSSKVVMKKLRIKKA